MSAEKPRIKKSYPSKTQYCAAIGCSNCRGKNRELSFFGFPREEERCKKWIQNTNREDLLKKSPKSIQQLSLCEKHFERNQFKKPGDKGSGRGRIRLLRTAVPSLFAQVPIPSSTSRKQKSASKSEKPPTLKKRKPPKDQTPVTQRRDPSADINRPTASIYTPSVAVPVLVWPVLLVYNLNATNIKCDTDNVKNELKERILKRRSQDVI